MPNALREDALLVTVKRDGEFFLGNLEVTPDDLASLIKTRLKGVFIGFGLFLAGLVFVAIVSISFAFGRGQVQAQHAASLSVVYGWTIGNPLFYLGLLGCILIGVTVAGSWPKPVR
jgi:hypothetical protein